MKTVFYLLRRPFIPPLLLFLFAFFIRIVNLGNIPYGFHMDEVANTYIGRFILTNGKDIYGNSWPLLYFNKFGDFPPVIPMYLSGLSSFLFGLNSFAARFPAALIGSLLVLPLYYLFRNLFSPKLAVVSCLYLAILPWHVALSRSSSEGIIGLTVFVTGLTFLFYGLQKQNKYYIFFSWFWLALSYFLYPSFRVLTPLVLLPVPFLAAKTNLKKMLLLTVVVFITLTALVATTDWGRGRFEQTSLFLNPTDRTVINNNLQLQITSEGNNSAMIAHLFHNKLVGYGQRLFDQYLSYFSPNFLFFQSGLPARYQTAHVGLIYLSVLLLGVVYLIRSKVKIKRPYSLYFLYLLLVSVIPSAISVDDFPNLHRSVFMIIPLLLFIAIAVINFYEVFRNSKKWIKIGAFSLFGLIFAAELIYSSHQYYVLSGKINSFYRTDGNLQMAQWLINNKNSYPEIILPNDNWLPVYYLFATEDFRPSYIGQFQSNFQIPEISNLKFQKNNCPTRIDLAEFPELDQALVVVDGNCNLERDYADFKVLENIQRVDGTSAFRLLKESDN
jgi:4-amino-4-deoxy-L-arabinose transferase-like glycosyltransferase